MNNNTNNNFTMNLNLNKLHYLDISLRAGDKEGENPSPTASPPDFDFNLPCRAFKSSFARSLSLNSSSNHCRSLDYEVRSKSGNSSKESCIDNKAAGAKIFGGAFKRFSSPSTKESTNFSGKVGNILLQNEDNCDSNRPPAIPPRLATQNPQQQLQQHVSLAQFRPAAAGGSVNTFTASACLNKSINQQQQPHSSQHVVNADFVNNNHSKNRKHVVWPTDGSGGEQEFELLDEVEDLDTSNASTGDCMSTNQPTQHHHPRALYEPHEDAVNVEAVVLQNQVDTLQWQLKQVETSCEMYRAVMEEVGRFLVRYHAQRQQQLLDRCDTEQITRSKSMHHVFVEGGVDDDASNGGYEKLDACSHELSAASCLRARSSTNLVDSRKTLSKLKQAERMAPPKNYNDFKDYTWRRSPKKLRDPNPFRNGADAEEKLTQEAFRLSRTINNLLSTSLQQPDLTQHRSSLAGGSVGRLRKSSVTASNAALTQPLHNSTGLSTAGADSSSSTYEAPDSKSNKLGSTASSTGSEMLFLRSLNIRDSRLSLRSSTDSSVHSTSSSSKLETDEEHSPFSPHHPTQSAPKPIPQFGSATEDESGFSSISSFQEIGVPLSSTMISMRNSISNSAMALHEINNTSASESTTLRGVDVNADSRNSTLKASALPALTPTKLSNAVGLPMNNATDLQQRKTYRNAPSKFQQRFSTLSNDDSTMVLWV